MTSRKRTPIDPERLPYVLFGRAAIPAILVSLVCVLVAAGVSGLSGFVAALIGAAIVVVFYLFDLAALRVAERLHGSALMPVMLTGYVIKVGLLAILVAALWQSSDIDMEVLAATVVAATITWICALTVVAARTATFFVGVDPPPRVESETKPDGVHIGKSSNASAESRSSEPS